MITIVDYNVGNLKSIANMLSRIGFQSQITSDVNIIDKAERLILPGVGAFDNAMESIEKLALHKVLSKKALIDGIPVLGICLGMQIMAESSEEGTKKGFGWIKASIVKFDTKEVKVPHMGWNKVTLKRDNFLFNGLERESKFYFLHSYYAKCKEPSLEIASANYPHPFTCAFQQDNIFAVQFHPEKSLRYGMQLMKNFAECKI